MIYSYSVHRSSSMSRDSLESCLLCVGKVIRQPFANYVTQVLSDRFHLERKVDVQKHNKQPRQETSDGVWSGNGCEGWVD